MMCVGVRACVMCAYMECVVGECVCVCVLGVCQGYWKLMGRDEV